MDTKYWNLRDLKQMDGEADDAIGQAADLLKKGEAVSFPTETVYGIGADATSEAAVAKIFAAKGRPADNPLIAHVASKSLLKEIITTLPRIAEHLINTFTPGPMTFVLPSNGSCAGNVTADSPTIGVRIPSHPTAQKLLKTCALPIAAPSANLSGRPSPTTAAHVWTDLNGRISGLLDDGPTGIGLESTVIDCTRDVPVILRPGGISKAMIEAELRFPVQEAVPSQDAEKPRAPGMKYTHYAPRMPLWLVDGGVEAIQQTIDRERKNGKKVGVMAQDMTAAALKADYKTTLGENLPAVAANIYDALRSFDGKEVDIIMCETFPEAGIGNAIMNRLSKASSARISDGAGQSPF